MDSHCTARKVVLGVRVEHRRPRGMWAPTQESPLGLLSSNCLVHLLKARR